MHWRRRAFEVRSIEPPKTGLWASGSIDRERSSVATKFCGGQPLPSCADDRNAILIVLTLGVWGHLRATLGDWGRPARGLYHPASPSQRKVPKGVLASPSFPAFSRSILSCAAPTPSRRATPRPARSSPRTGSTRWRSPAKPCRPATSGGPSAVTIWRRIWSCWA